MAATIVMLGAGNVATHLSLAFQKIGYSIVQVYSKTQASASQLANLLHTAYTTDIKLVFPTADIYLYALADDALCELILRVDFRQGLHIHTAGSIPLSVFGNKFERFGVLYPLQTFSKVKPIDISNVPFFVEGNSQDSEQEILAVASQLSATCVCVNSEERLKLHIAAVFACNFTNYLYGVAQNLLANTSISFEVLKPLILETAHKVEHALPIDAQTGPARRNDMKTIQKHTEALKNPTYKMLYKMLSDSISAKYSL
ncbi:MAG: hypothetical protein AUK44_01935 [Porphyromonadaceae bacterium CG2_30_38_12]|nr:MAG: hypothetical protein AUK44_01935 [Porphyromonadaceae bacterium CG2_30_38_12]